MGIVVPKLIRPTRTINVLGAIPPVPDVPPEPEWVAEDYTGYTEKDDFNRLSETSIQVTFLTPGKNVDIYLYKDKTAAFFDGSFKARFAFRITTASHQWGQAFPFVIANTLNDVKGIEDASGDCLGFQIMDGTPGANYWMCNLREVYGGTAYEDAGNWYNFSYNTYYWVIVERDETVGANGTLYGRVYSDVDYSNLLHTLTLTLHGKVDFRYLYGFNNYNNGDSSANIGGTFHDLSLQMPA